MTTKLAPLLRLPRISTVAAAINYSASCFTSVSLPAALDMFNGSPARHDIALQSTNIYNIRDFCTNQCTSISDQTAGFLRAAIAANAARGGTIYIPQFAPTGLEWNFDASIGGPMRFVSYHVNIQGEGSPVILVKGGSFAAWGPANGFSTGGSTVLSDFELYESDNSASGAQILLDRSNNVSLQNIILTGGHIGLDIASSQNLHAHNLSITSSNSHPDAVLMRIRRSGPFGAHNEIFFDDLSLNTSSTGGMPNNLVIHDADGMFVSNGHIGGAEKEAVLIQPEFATDTLDNIRFNGVDFDGAGFGVRFVPLSGYTGLTVIIPLPAA